MRFLVPRLCLWSIYLCSPDRLCLYWFLPYLSAGRESRRLGEGVGGWVCPTRCRAYKASTQGTHTSLRMSGTQTGQGQVFERGLLGSLCASRHPNTMPRNAKHCSTDPRTQPGNAAATPRSPRPAPGYASTKHTLATLTLTMTICQCVF